MSNKQSINHFSAKRLTVDAVLVALYFALSMLAISVGGFKLTFEHLPVILCAVVYGPLDALLVGALGEFLNQLLTFGVTPTTVLWILPALFRGLSMGIGARVLRRQLGLEALLERKIPAAFLGECVISGIVCSVINTAVLYLDSKMFGYYSYAMVFGVFWVRIGTSAVSSVLMAAAAKPVAHAMKKAGVI